MSVIQNQKRRKKKIKKRKDKLRMTESESNKWEGNEFEVQYKSILSYQLRGETSIKTGKIGNGRFINIYRLDPKQVFILEG